MLPVNNANGKTNHRKIETILGSDVSKSSKTKVARLV